MKCVFKVFLYQEENTEFHVVSSVSFCLYCMLSIICMNKPTRCFNRMTHFTGPAYRVQEGTPHVAPEIWDGVLRGVALVGIHQPHTATNNRVYDGNAGPTHVFGVHHLHTHTYSKRGPHALCQLGRRQKEGGKGTEMLIMCLINPVKLNH